MKKVLILCLALALAVGSAITGTIAYLQDTAEAVNVAVVGNVEIEMHEQQRDENGDLVDFVQSQKLYPAYVTDDSAYTVDAATGMWPAELKGAMDKLVTVENTGTAECYFRTWIAFECPTVDAYGAANKFKMNINEDAYDWTEHGYETINGVQYLIMCATHKEALTEGESSAASLKQVVMTDAAENEDVKLLGNEYEILVYTQAVQTENFKDATVTGNQTHADLALTTAFGNDDPWGDKYNYPTDESVSNLPEGFPKAKVVHNPAVTEFEIDFEYGGSYGAEKVPLQSGLYTFSITETDEEVAANQYKGWSTDYYVTFNRDVNKNQVNDEVEIALVGYYESFNMAGAVYAELTKDMMPLPLLGSVTQNPWTYEDIASLVKEFQCGVSVDPFGQVAANGHTVEPFELIVELRLTNPNDETEFYTVSKIIYEYEG